VAHASLTDELGELEPQSIDVLNIRQRRRICNEQDTTKTNKSLKSMT